MTDKVLPLLGQSGLSPVMMTGEVVVNARKDMGEYESRQGDFGVGGVIHIAHIAQNDMCFIRKGKQPLKQNGFGDNEFAMDVFVAFNGATHELDQAFTFIGIARAPPMHQNMQGRETGEWGFAMQIGGSRTIQTRSLVVIPIGSRLVWKIPRDLTGLPLDTSKHGRILAEIAPYKPSDAVVLPQNLHAMIYRQMFLPQTLADMNIAERALHSNAWKVWEGLSALAFAIVLVHSQVDTVTYPNGVPAAKKLQLAGQYGVTEISDRSPTATADKKRFQDTNLLLLNSVFQSKWTGEKSVPTDDYAAFESTVNGGYNPNAQQVAVAAKHSSAYLTIYDTMINMYADQQSRVFAWTMNGGHPGHDMDVVLKRI